MVRAFRGFAVVLVMGIVMSMVVPVGLAAAAGSKSPVNILVYGDFSLLQAEGGDASYSGVFNLAAAQANAQGGINGHPVHVIICDTELNAGKAASCVAKAKSEGIVAAIPSEELLDNVTTPLLIQQGVPSLGANPSTPVAQYSKTSACFLNGPYIIYPSQLTYSAKYLHAKSMSIVEPPGVDQVSVLTTATTDAAKAVGMTVPSTLAPSLTATDYSTQVAQMTSAGQDEVDVFGAGPGEAAIIRSATSTHPGIKITSAGYAVFTQPTPALDATMASVGAKGMLVSSYTSLATDTSLPLVKKFHALMAKTYPADESSEVPFFFYVDWTGAMEILRSIPAGSPVTAATATTALQHAKNISFGGAIPNWSYDYNTLGLGCVTNNYTYLSQFNGTKFVALNNDQPVKGISTNIVHYYQKALASESK